MKLLNLVLIGAFYLSFPAFAQSGSAGVQPSGGGECGMVKVDCDIHKIMVGSIEKTCNCGANGTTPDTKGTVGGPHHGDIVKDGVDIQAPGMGQDGGGKVFHTPNPDDKSSVPQGNDSTKGCVAVDNEVLEMLKKCKGATLEINGNGENKGGGGSVNGTASGSTGTQPTSGGSRGVRD